MELMQTALITLICIFIIMLWFFTLAVSSFITYVICKKKLKQPKEEKLNEEEKIKNQKEKKYTENLFSYNGDKQN
jgi:phosphotransferase system  glucose/maltose/N-acetylglucosamine-specific IIC component